MARIAMYAAFMLAAITISVLPSVEDPDKTLIPPFCGIVLVILLVGYALWVEFFYKPKPKPRHRTQRRAHPVAESGEPLVPPVESRPDIPNRPLTPAEIRQYFGDDAEVSLRGQTINKTGNLGGKNNVIS